MSKQSIDNSIILSIWNNVTKFGLDLLSAENTPRIIMAFFVGFLLDTKFSKKEVVINHYLEILDTWTDALSVTNGVLDESSTGMLGLWIWIRKKSREKIDRNLIQLFNRSVEHNIKKQKPLSLSNSVILMIAVTYGVGITNPSKQILEKVRLCLDDLLEDAKVADAVTISMAWQEVFGLKDPFSKNLWHKFKMSAENENNNALERGMAYFGLYIVSKDLNEKMVGNEINMIALLSKTVKLDQFTDSLTLAYFCLLPYLGEKLSSPSLHRSWEHYTEKSFKKAKTENYITRALIVLAILGIAFVMNIPWFTSLAQEYQASFGSFIVTIVLLMVVYTIELISDLHGKKFWQRGRVEILVTILGTIISFIFFVLGILSK